ncbi:hypothetical protein GGI19_003290 [Coemansia pectinata]|uniref:NADH dehydrogenase [ubiquinone] 1 beta subcomplex subunit 7 n=1 Tax=Coemansia pectinata TaxID=1052879 RepID=A0A9W8GY08_9FUNG|nr:hypothetical protein GGI19_003290 [Coemansia pectinata]
MTTLLSCTIRVASASSLLRRAALMSTSSKEPSSAKDRRTKKKAKDTSDASEGELRLNEQEQAMAAANDATFGKEGARVVPASPYKSRMAEFTEPEMKATAKEMAEARLPLRYRDYCAHMLIPLNKCRHKTMYLPWKCEEERHAYEKCEYEDFMRRSKMLAQIKSSQEEQ